MRTYAIVLCAFYCVAKLYSRYWLFRPVPTRPILTRSNDSLHVLDLSAILALCAAFFFMIQRGNLLRPIWWVAGLVLLDLAARYFFLEMEMRRLRSRSQKWSRRGARQHVRRRAAVGMFH